MNKARPSTPQHDPPQPQRNTVLVAKERPIDFTQDGKYLNSVSRRDNDAHTTEPTYFLRDTIPLSLVNNTKVNYSLTIMIAQKTENRPRWDLAKPMMGIGFPTVF